MLVLRVPAGRGQACVLVLPARDGTSCIGCVDEVLVMVWMDGTPSPECADSLQASQGLRLFRRRLSYDGRRVKKETLIVKFWGDKITHSSLPQQFVPGSRDVYPSLSLICGNVLCERAPVAARS